MTEPIIRLSCFIGVLCIVAMLELVFPKRKLRLKKSYRWSNNLALVVLNTVVIRLVFPIAAVGVAFWCNTNNIGALNYFKIAEPVNVIIAFIILDLSIYVQHLIFHYIPLLWSIHKVHHADMDIDVTTGLRFHPLEMILSMLIKMTIVAIIGAPVLAVIIFEIILNAGSLFNHGNIRLPKIVDKILRFLIVTPDMHRVHHSTILSETNSNFGFNLSVWDRVFKTYKAQPSKGHLGMDIGLDEYKDPKMSQKLQNILKIPFNK